MKTNNPGQPLNKLATKGIRLLSLPHRVWRKARSNGLRRSTALAAGIAATQLKSRISGSRRFIFISHPINNTGAPLVLLQIVREVAAAYGPKAIRIIAANILDDIKRELKQERIAVEKGAHNLGDRLTGLQLALHKDDFVLMNTVAVYDNYRNHVFAALKSGRLQRAYWFIHEDISQLKVVAPQLLVPKNLNLITRLANAGKLTILVPSKRIQADYGDLFRTGNVVVAPLRVAVPERYTKPRSADEYQTVNFILSGTPNDGRKGQLIALAAFHEFIATSYRDHPKRYRDFSFHLISIGDDYISQQIKSLGNNILGKRVHFYPALPFDKALDVTSKCNAVICCSLNETFGLYVAEGMFMGHVVLRNGAAGMEEQLRDGKNGYYINEKDIHQFAANIERLLNKHTNSNEQLQQMGATSQQIIQPYATNTYLSVLSLAD